MQRRIIKYADGDSVRTFAKHDVAKCTSELTIVTVERIYARHEVMRKKK